MERGRQLLGIAFLALALCGLIAWESWGRGYFLTEEVLLAREPIEAGTALSAALFSAGKVEKDSLAEGALTPEQLALLQGKVTNSQIPQNGQITVSQLREQDFYLGGMNVLPFATPHDANQPVGMRFECNGAVFCLATDLGCIRKGWMNRVMGADAVLLESNYDPDMLKAGSYPYDLKRRILSNRGHLCNDDASACALELVKNGAKHIVLGHLSKENNFPELARRCTEDALMSGGVVPGEDMRLDVASRDGVTGIFAVSSGFR